MNQETRDAIRMAISGQKEEPVTLKTTATIDGETGLVVGQEEEKSKTVFPEFDRFRAIIDALASRNAQLAIEVAELQAILTEREQFIEANAELLGIQRIDSPHQH